MALSADDKEKIMASRGESAAPSAKKAGPRGYLAIFADGKRSFIVDMQNEPEEELIRSVTAIFKPGYVVSINPL